MLDAPALITDDETGTHYVSLDALIGYGERTYDLALTRTLDEARLAGSFTEYFRHIKRELDAQDDHAVEPKPLVGEADPELERLLAQEDEIDRLVARGWSDEDARDLVYWASKGGK